MTPQMLASMVLADLHKMQDFHSRYEEQVPFVGLTTEMREWLAAIAATTALGLAQQVHTIPANAQRMRLSFLDAEDGRELEYIDQGVACYAGSLLSLQMFMPVEQSQSQSQSLTCTGCTSSSHPTNYYFSADSRTAEPLTIGTVPTEE